MRPCRPIGLARGQQRQATVAREAGALLAKRITFEPGAPDDTLPRLQVELERMAQWLGLSDVRVGDIIRPA